MSFYKRRRPKQEEEKCADPAKARARALDALASREMSSAQLYEQETLLLHVNVIVAGIMSKCTIKRKKIMEKHSCCQRTNTL